MSENFKKLKRKYVLGAILKCVVCGLSFGLFAAGVVLLALKLSAINLGVIWYVLIGIGAAILGGGVAFVFFRPTDKKVAERLDNEFVLDERVQTSLEFSGKEGTILELQRADTEERLKSLPKSKPKFSRMWQYCVICVLAVAVALTAFFIPAAQAEGPSGSINPDDVRRVVTDFELQQVRDIISDVNRSSVKASVKQDTVGKLEDFLEELAAVQTQGQLNRALDDALTDVEDVYAKAVTYTIFATALEAEGETIISKAILAGGNSYKTYRMMTYENAETFYEVRGNATASKVTSAMNGLDTKLNVALSDGLGDVLDGLIADVMPALSADGVSDNDGLYAALNEFVGSLTLVYLDVLTNPELEDDTVQSSIQNLIGTLRTKLMNELAEQSYHGAMRRFISNRLKSIFGRTDLEYPEEDSGSDQPGNGTTGTDNPPPDGTDGTDGNSQQKNGSNDMIWDPRVGDYRPFGEVFNEFYAMMLEEKEDGNLTPEMQAMIEAFFNYLRGNNSTDNK